jgi:hypothetical protein
MAMTPEQFAQRFTAAARALPRAIGRTARKVFDLVGQSATGRHMRDKAAAEPKRRRKGDTGPLRIVSGTLLRAVLNQPGAGGVERTRVEGLRAELSKGVSLRSVEYARIHEKGGEIGGFLAGQGVRMPARPYLGPAADDVRPQIEQVARDEAVKAIKEALS